jgi:hypothetical protein
MKILILIAAVFLFVKCAGKFGFRKTLQWAAVLIISVFPLSLAGALVARPLEFLWSTGERMAVAGAALAVFVAAIKRFGWGGALSYGFQIAGFVSAVVLIGFSILLIVLVIGHGGF